MPRPPQHPDPAPLETDDVLVVAVGTAAWALGLVVLLVLRTATDVRVEDWWLVMCAAGIALGAFGVRYCRRRREHLPRA